eukprot:COSAG02_NODE_65241_length_258_cov_0.974843_1_plen_28_part_10
MYRYPIAGHVAGMIAGAEMDGVQMVLTP